MLQILIFQFYIGMLYEGPCTWPLAGLGSELRNMANEPRTYILSIRIETLGAEDIAKQTAAMAAIISKVSGVSVFGYNSRAIRIQCSNEVADKLRQDFPQLHVELAQQASLGTSSPINFLDVGLN